MSWCPGDETVLGVVTPESNAERLQLRSSCMWTQSDRELAGSPDAGGSRESRLNAWCSTLDRALHLEPAGHHVIVAVVGLASR